MNRFRRTITGFAATVALTAAVIAGGSSAEASPGQTDKDHGCPSGAVCIYPDATWNGDSPTYVFWTYGWHRIYDQYGKHRVYNNQYGGAVVDICRSSDLGTCSYIPEGYFDTLDLTPINLVHLRAD